MSSSPSTISEVVFSEHSTILSHVDAMRSGDAAVMSKHQGDFVRDLVRSLNSKEKVLYPLLQESRIMDGKSKEAAGDVYLIEELRRLLRQFVQIGNGVDKAKTDLLGEIRNILEEIHKDEQQELPMLEEQIGLPKSGELALAYTHT